MADTMWEVGWAAGHLKKLFFFVEYINIVHPLIRNNGKELHPKIRKNLFLILEINSS